ncbi:MAG: damage-control phosphatase ARMT1 family protein [Longibaculum sp.]
MKIRDKCLPCLVNQVVKVAHMTNAQNKEELYHRVFDYLKTLDFELTNPEIIGQTFRLVKQHIQNDDPYKDIRDYYNDLFFKHLETFRQSIEASDDAFEMAIRYAIIGNIIDFSPMHNHDMNDIMKYFENIQNMTLAIHHVNELKEDLKNAKTLLYLGDNCGEICLDYLLIEKIKQMYPNLRIYFATRGAAVVNDSILEDAYTIGMDQYATLIDNGDDSLGTILHRTSDEFRKIYQQADVVIAKGQANYESLSEEKENIYYLLMVKCDVIADDIGVAEKSLVCFHQ